VLVASGVTDATATTNKPGLTWQAVDSQPVWQVAFWTIGAYRIDTSHGHTGIGAARANPAGNTFARRA